MPIPEDKMRRPESLHRWFAVASILMTASILWMIKVDYDRPWRDFQDRFFVGKAALAHLEYLDAVREERRQEIEDARQRVNDAREFVAQAAGERRQRMIAELTESDLRFRKANGEWSRKSQVLDVTKNTYEATLAQYGVSHPETREAHQQLTSEEERVESLRKEKEHWEDEKARLERALRELNAPVEEARKRLRDLEKASEDALAKDQQYRGVLTDEGLLGGLPIVSSLINLPLLDFTAPKNTPSRHQVNQLVLPNVRQRLNYLESYTTDRCTTCHVAIDDPEFSKEHLARELEKALPGINEGLQRMGRDPFDVPVAPVLAGSDTALPVGKVTHHWEKLTTEQQNRYFEDLLKFVNHYLRLSGRKTINLGQPILAHPDLDLYVSVDSPHPQASMGCTVCHEGNPQETDFVLAAHTPPTHEVREEWEEEYYVRRLGVPTSNFETVEHYWDRPMRLPKYTQAGCAKCHTQITDIARYDGERVGQRINLGRYLFTTVGCVNCHNVAAIPNPRRVGPDLTHVASKLQPEFVQQWAYTPQEFRPSTRMPHFFHQENNREESANSLDPDPTLRTQTEVAAISKYLFAVSKPWEPLTKPDAVTGDAERGRELFKVAGCLACHANLTEFGEQWITDDLVQRTRLDENTARNRYRGMTPQERVRYAMEHFTPERDTFLRPETARFDPASEHHTPVLTRFAPELSGIGSKVNGEWLYSWLIDPTHYAPETRMPSLRLTPREATDIAAYLLTLTNNRFPQYEFELTPERRTMADELVFSLLSAQRSERRSRAIMEDANGELTDMLVSRISSSFDRDDAYDLIRPMSVDDKKLFYLGNKMIAHYGCYACHRIPGFEETTPPGTDLSAWAEKPVTQLDFAFYDEAFHDMREEHEEKYGYLYPQDADDLNEWSPIEDRAREQITHTHAAFAKHKMLNPRLWDRGKIKGPYDKLKMPNYYFTEEEAEALTTYLLSRLPPRVNDVLQVDYDEQTSGPIARGRDLTRELNCIACHQIEDNAPTIQQYFRRKIGDRWEFDSINAPPLLWGEGAKVQHNWLHRFLQHVEPLRPWLQVRMPTFPLTGEEATTLVEYFAALSQQDSQRLAKAKAKVDEYRERHTDDDKTSPTSNEPADWFAQESLADATAALRRWAVDRQLMREGELDPLHNSRDLLREAHARLLERVEFMQELYDVEYPFVEPPTPLSSQEYFERGRRFFNDMGCLQCHVLGDMLPGPAENTDAFVQTYRLDSVRGEGDEAVAVLNGTPYPVGSVIDGHKLISAENIYYDTGDVETKAVVEGPDAKGETERVLLVAPSAPNLSLTYQRLRRAWVYRWMLEPQWIQPGTKMPQNFPDGQSPFEGDPEYPGTGQDHINLLVDFLYHAGAVNARAELRKVVVAEKPEEFEEEGAEEFFEE